MPTKTKIVLGFIIALALGGLCTVHDLPAQPAPPTRDWFLLERKATLQGMNNQVRELFVACDTYTGTLLYIVGTPGTAITAVPGGCARAQ